MSNRCLIFLHIPKTAGSTFHMILSSRFHKSETKNVFGSRYSEPEIYDFIEQGKIRKHSLALLKGHMPFGLHEYIDNKAEYITFLRNPIDRVVSQYYYVKKNQYNPLHAQVEKQGMSISDFVSSGIAIGMNNGQCRFLAGDLDHFAFNACTDELLMRALDHVKRHFIWLGVTDRFDESVLLLSRILGWRRPPFYIRENVSKVRKNLADIDPSEIEVIKEYNKYDLALYDYANSWLDGQIEDCAEFPELLSVFRDRNSKIQRRWSWLPERLRRHVI